MRIVPVSFENSVKCACPICPTYHSDPCPNEGMENLYCARKMSACQLTRKGCLCPTCQVWVKYKLTKQYYCLFGIAKKKVFKGFKEKIKKALGK
ncbi:MAG TPA: hypothetical protein DIT25_00410 [Candidatus Moranbacteria bacterium]|nr:hypothetical protein [Candidatus Moranbacteria bacterium]